MNVIRRIGTPEFVRFLAVGTVAYIAYMAIYTTARPIMSPTAAMTLAYAVAVILHYSLSRRFTFRVTGSSPAQFAREVPRYATLLVLGYCLNLMFFTLGRLAHAPDVISLTVGILANTVLTFVACRFWIFKATP